MYVGGDMYMDTSTGDLIQPIGGNEYIDYSTGEVIFVYEEGALHTHDLAKLKASFEQHRVQLSADTIKARFGLSDERSLEIAKLSVQLADTPRRALTTADYDSFMKEVTGSTIAEVQSALAKSTEGSTQDLENLLDRAAVVNGIGPEHARELFKQILAQ